MKNKTLKELIENYPNEIPFEEIVDFENFDERLSVVNCIVVNIIGVLLNKKYTQLRCYIFYLANPSTVSSKLSKTLL
ncbi:MULTISPECIES: hypothetical protein [unclassified Empedobacter]|uniref:hypothetical protein n=1 Tax=unclassified Empedobacter TaxID=2643773 RepID=UPI0025C26B37|nr:MULTISPECIES: hypothetical protein [unclassified Empedobacter]